MGGEWRPDATEGRACSYPPIDPIAYPSFAWSDSHKIRNPA